MSTPSAVPRTTLIGMAPKPSRLAHRQASLTADCGSGTRSSRHTPDPESPPSPTPCEACSSRRIACKLSDKDESCISCLISRVACSPMAHRKRKRHVDVDSDSVRSSAARPDERRLQTAHMASGSLIDMAHTGALERALGLETVRNSHCIGPTTDLDPYLINPSGCHTPKDSAATEGLVAFHGRRLVDLYFRIVHPAFPILQKTDFCEKYERSCRELSPPLLAVVYILATNWWDQDEELAALPRPDVATLERLVRTALADAVHRPTLSTMQAGLLLSQRPEGNLWAPTGQLVATGHELGLHLDCSLWKLSAGEKGLRKRVAWALYMQDKWGALMHGQPSHICSANWAVQPLTRHDFADADAERGRVLFSQMVQLTQILAAILDAFYTLQAASEVAAAGSAAVQLVLARAKPIQLRLKTWHSNLPDAVRMDTPSYFPSWSSAAAAAGRLDSCGYLHLAYFAAEIILHRRIIRALDTSALVDPALVYICRDAAKARLISAMDFVNRLSPLHLGAFWYFASKANFALVGTFGSLLWLTSAGREEADWYRRRLGEYRWTLSVSGGSGSNNDKGAAPARTVGGGRKTAAGAGGLTEFAMDMLDISTGLLSRLPEKPLLAPADEEYEEVGGGRRPSSLALGTGYGGGSGHGLDLASSAVSMGLGLKAMDLSSATLESDVSEGQDGSSDDDMDNY